MPNRAPDFRFIFSNTIGFGFSDNDAKIMFSIDEGNGLKMPMSKSALR